MAWILLGLWLFSPLVAVFAGILVLLFAGTKATQSDGLLASAFWLFLALNGAAFSAASITAVVQYDIEHS